MNETNVPQSNSQSRSARFSVACNFDPQLIDRLEGLPVYEVYGKLTADYFGGGRPSFYLPQISPRDIEAMVSRCHRSGVEFNYLLNSSSMNNLEFTTEGQKQLRKLLDWLSRIGVDSITVSNLFFLRAIKRRYPNFKVRVSAHRETDNARKARFWEENGADCIVISETTTHREFERLQSIRDAVSVDLSLIVNNWCRQDCAIANNHAVGLSNASRTSKQHFPLDYCSVYCNAFRVDEPVNYVRANWIRPEDLHLYQQLGYSNFKIVERNTPTDLLEMRVRAYAQGRYDGNLLDLVQNYAYPKSVMAERDGQFFSMRRMAKYFLRPSEVNLLRFVDVVRYGQELSLLYPRTGDNPVYVDNRALDGFMDRFLKTGCENVDCESCHYCHRWADRAVKMDPAWVRRMKSKNEDLLRNLHDGSLWESPTSTLKKMAKNWLLGSEGVARREVDRQAGAAVPGREQRTLRGRHLPVVHQSQVQPTPLRPVSVGNSGPSPREALQSPEEISRVRSAEACAE